MEAIVEAIAAHQPEVNRDRWAMMAILSQLDQDYGEHNPDARGITAAAQAALEGVDSRGCAVLACWRDEGFPSSLGEEDRALVAALRVAAEILDGVDAQSFEGDDLALAVAAHLKASAGASFSGVEFHGRMGGALSLLGTLGEDATALAAVAAESLLALEEARP